MTDEELQHLLTLDAAPGPALAIDAADADAIVEAALVGAGFGPGGGGSGGSSGGSGRASGPGGAGGSAGASGGTMAAGTKLALVAAAALVVVAIALLAWRGRRGGPQQLATPTPDAAIDSAIVGTGTPSPEPSGDPALAARPADDPPPGDPPPVEPAPDDPSRETERPRDDASADRSRRTKPTREPSRADEVADLLGEANAKRAAKQWRESDALYARVVRLAPKTLAAQTALVASASLHLEHLGDPKGAAQRFRRALALAPAGALAEDARWGLVEAARASRDAAGEAAALDEFLAHHPRSPLAPRAKARRAELP